MNRPWQTWLAFALCAGLALCALAWLTDVAVRADLSRTTSTRIAELEQKVSLVLWRMDTKLAPLIAEEVARPVSFFSGANQLAFNAEDPFGSVQATQPDTSQTLPDNVILNFRCASDGACESPQVPSTGGFGASEQAEASSDSRIVLFSKLAREVNYRDLIANLEELSEDDLTASSLNYSQEIASNSYFGNPEAERQLKSPPNKGKISGFQQRAQRYEDVTKQQLRSRGGESANAPAQVQQAAPEPQRRPSIVEGVSRPIWVGDKLLLVRRVLIDGRSEVQGSWLDWDGIRADLLEEAADLLPDASLSPVHDTAEADPTRMLAGLPVSINTGEKLTTFEISEPMRWALWIAWLAFLFALIAAALLLAGVIALSERRAAFVSSVTHELRSPLTTFRMYSDMLARGMVPDAERRQQYLETLRTEAERLTHLVENVLAYARLERGRKNNNTETLQVAAIADRLQGRLQERASQSEFQLSLDLTENVGDRLLRTDVSVVEQILFNLVDNACKYAADATDRTLHWIVQSSGDHIEFVIHDHGPGFDSPNRAQQAKPFSKTSEEAAVSAPGVGLGLALCRKLAKQLGGRLDIVDSPQGVTATLRLPTASAA